MPLSPKLTADQLATNLADIAPPYTEQQALVESSRCLFCFDAPCITACPTGIDIPAFIKKIVTGNLTGAARTILSANILGASCARVCPTEVLCEGACVMLDRDRDPIKIGRLQRYATDHVYENRIPVLRPAAKRSGKRVAVIGGGPAGMGCAAELAQLGHEVVIFERKPNAGGLNTYGIAYYKMKPEVSLEEVELVKSLGVEFRCGVEVGKDVTRAELDQFDAIFIGVGLGEGQRLRIPGEDLPEVVDALTFIEQIHTEPLQRIPVGARVAVIGCGNTAIDAATQARRLGADEVVVIYRRSERQMSAYAFEYDLAKRDGVTFLFHHAPVEVLGKDGHVTGLRLARTRFNASGALEQIEGSEFTEPFDMVLKAVGQQKQSDWLAKVFPELELNRNGTDRARLRDRPDEPAEGFRWRRLREWRPRSGQRGRRRQEGGARNSPDVWAKPKSWARSSLRAGASRLVPTAPVSMRPSVFRSWKHNTKRSHPPPTPSPRPAR